MLALEPRFLFDGAAAATVEQQEPAPAPEVQDTQQTEAESVAAEQLIQPDTAEVSESSLTDTVGLTPKTSASEVVFVDTAVENYTELLTGISPYAEVIVLDSGRDGIQQITEVLAGRENLQAVHILSHGVDGAVRLGNLWLQDSNLDQYADAIAGWATALSSDADLLIYGCNLVSSEVGRSFITALAGLTGADVAASEDPTGHASMAGDWDLEFKTGTIEAQIVVSDAEQNAWYHTLAVPTLVAAGTVADSVNAITPGLPTGLAVDDVLLLFVETANQAVSIANQNGGTWTEVTLSPQGTGTTAAGTRLAVFWSRYNGTQGAPTTSDSGNHQVGQIFAFRGVVTSGNPFDITSGATDVSDTSLSVPGATTTVADTLVVVAASISMAAGTENFGGTWTNADLANLTLLNNFLGTAGNDGRIAVLTGEKAAAGAYGTTDNTLTAANTKGLMTIALKPNVAPVIGNLNTDALAYSEGAGAVVIDQGTGATVTDGDSANFDNGALTVSFTAGSDSAEDELAIRNQGTGAGQIGVSGSNVTYGGVTIGTYAGGSGGANLVITFNASATPAAVQALVQNITYQDTDIDAPTTGARTVQFVVTDGDGGTSAAVSATVTVSGVNDIPVLGNLNADALAYSEGAGALVIDQGTAATVTDVDSANFDTGTLTMAFTAGSDSAEDELAIRNQGMGVGQIGVSGSNVTYNFGAGAVVIGTFAGGSGGANLIITFNSSATSAAVQALVQNITYQNTDTDAPTTGARTVQFVVTDGDGGTSAAVSATVTVSGVNDAPVVAGAGGTLAYTEGDGAQVIDATLAITDVDDTNIESATITISGGFVSSEDVLAFTNTANITGVWNPATGILTLSGTDTLANYELALESITYQNTNTDNPNTGNRTITWVVNDGTANSAGVTSTITVAGVNDAPLSTNDTLTIAEDTTTLLSVNDFGSYSDVDLDALAAVQITTLETNGALEYDTTGAGAWAAVTLNQIVSAADIAAGRLRFVPDADENASPYTTIGFKVGDGTVFSTAAYTLTVNVTPVNDAPVVTADASTAYTQNASAVVVDSSTPVTDVDDTNIESATVTISNVDRATDVLTLNAAATTAAATAGITVTAYNPATGELVLSGTATEADYQTVLEGIQFSSTSATAGNRSISYVVNDGNVDSAATNATIVYSTLNAAPRIDDAAVAFAENSANGTAVYNVNEFFTGNDTDIDGTALTYAITAGNGLGGFAINAATGQVTVANSAALDFETTPVFNLTVEASDGTLTDTAVITVNLNDLNEAPVANVTVGLNTPDLGEPSGAFPPIAPNPGMESGPSIGGPELSHRDFVLQGISESLRLRTDQAAQIAGLLTAANAGEIEAVSLGDGLRMEPAMFVLPTVELIRSEFGAAGERALEFAVKPAPGTAPLLKDYDAFSRFVGLDEPKDEPPPAAEPAPDAPAGAQDSDPAKAAPDAAVAPDTERGATRDSQPAGAPAFSAQLRTAAALRKQLDQRLSESLRAPRKS